jgi:2-hydroxycyclohexanecarboxyl-CoA dehydrogenase
MGEIKGIFDLSGRVALITGAGQGVGRGIALLLAEYNAAVVVNDFVVERARSVVEEIKTAGGKALAIQADVTDFAGVGRMFEEALKAFGKVDILVNNAGNAGTAGRGADKQFWEIDPEDWNWKGVLEVNLIGVMNCCRHALPGMVERKSGRLITIVSDAGRSGEGNGLEVYSGAKAGAAGFMRGLARSIGRYSITSNSVAIATTDTPWNAAVIHNPAAAEMVKKALSNYVIRRVGQPADVAAMVLLLASDAGSWVTGQTYPVNGGFAFSM